MVARKCKVCAGQFLAKQADINRGWAKCCSKRCASRFKFTNGTKDYKQMVKARLGGVISGMSQSERDHEQAMSDAEGTHGYEEFLDSVASK